MTEKFLVKIPRAKNNLILRQFYCLMQPRKQAILRTLEQSDQPMYIMEIAKAIKLGHRTTSFHLTDLKYYGFVSSRLKINKKDRASRYFAITPKVKEVKQKIIKVLQQ